MSLRDIGNPAQAASALDYSVSTSSSIPFAPNQHKLQWLTETVKDLHCISILEFGVGHSTIALAKALIENKRMYGDLYEFHQCRQEHPFTVFTVDTMKKWITHCKRGADRSVLANIKFCYSPARMAIVENKICTLYDKLPNVYPDFIYLDGPDQYSAKGSVRGITTRAIDRVPMAADILQIEFFLPPICAIAIDGRYHNTLFLRKYLKRDWTYAYNSVVDQHLFLLNEECPGHVSRRTFNYYQACRNRDKVL
jgi:hypothetical protein